MRSPLGTFLLLCTFTHAVAAEPDVDQNHWGQFRGPNGTGQSDAIGLPVNLTADSVLWSTELPVRGHSSPIVWGDRIFLTGTTSLGDQVQRHVICLRRDDGKLLWNHPCTTGSGESLHKMNSWATPSCATDGKYVCAFFGAAGFFCLDVEGQLLWSRQLGDFPGAWGVGASPIIDGDQVIQNGDAEGDSFLVSLDLTTGKDRWRTPRRAKPKGGWSTPVMIETPQRRELILNGEFGLQAYDPESGTPLWNCQSFNGRGTPMPAWGGGVLYVVNGKSGDVYAVRPGGDGDVTDTHMVWHTPRRGGRDLPSPVLASEVMLVLGMSGVATGYDAASGEELWKERLGGNYSGSPVVANGVVYALSEEGTVTTLRAGSQLDIVSRLPLRQEGDEVFRSSIGISDRRLWVRSDRRLYCLKNADTVN